jgi:hypothetical protein
VQKMMMSLLVHRLLLFYFWYTKRHHMSCPKFNVIINKFSIIKINFK